MPKWTNEQLRAIEEDGKNIIVSAGAGSGKTAVLSERVIYKLEHGIHINELLILTFTRAAAEEMKDRIRKKMNKNESLKDELDRVDSSYITTFDSFALSVVKKYHYLANIPKDISISDDSIIRIQKKKLLSEVFEEFYLKDNNNFKELINKYCVKNDKNIQKVILSIANKIENCLDPDENINYIKNEFYKEENIQKIIDQYNKFINEKKKNISLELENLSYYFDESYLKKVETVVLPIINSQSLEELFNIDKVSFPRVPNGTDEEAKNVKTSLNDAIKGLQSYKEFGTEEKIKEDILSTQNYSKIIIEIIEVYFRKLRDYKAKNLIYTFNDIASLAIKILKENETARLELKDSFKEIMIDEYQDTNDIQETFIGLIANNNVYMVGDIKQSIYKFRGSNPEIFKEKYNKYSQNDGGYKIDLLKNFRSRSEVLNGINSIFSLLMDDDLGGAKYYESHKMVYGNNDYDDKVFKSEDYNFEVLEYPDPSEYNFTKEETEIFAIAKDIKDKLVNKLEVYDKETSQMRLATYNDFVIILDRSKHFETFKKIFEYLGIPLTILQDGKLNTSTDILIIKNLIDFILHIKNQDYGVEFKYDFISIGRSFLYEYTDEYIFDIITNQKYFETSLYKDLFSITNLNSKSSSTLIQEILEVTDFYNKIYKVGSYEETDVRISKIYELSENLGKIGLDIEAFKNYLDDIVENDFEIKYTLSNPSTDSVKIITIHKSKGLEYPICYFADLDHEFNQEELKSKFIMDNKYGLILPVEGEESKDSVIKILYKNDFYKDEIDEKIRLFYVALTRAREKFIVILPEKNTTKLEKNVNGTIEYLRRIKFNKLSDFVYAFKDYLDSNFKKVILPELNMTKEYLNGSQIKSANMLKDVSDFEVKEIKVETEIKEEKHFSKSLPGLIKKEERKNMDFGTEVHEVLEFTDFKNFDPSKIENEFIRNKIISLLKSELFKNIGEAKIYREHEFIYEENATIFHGVIDLMLEYNDHIDIIDYKLKNTVDENYKKQLEGYKKYISNLTTKKINTYLYSIIDETIREV